MPIIQRPFDMVALDIAGPFPKSMAGYQYVLEIMEHATRYPEAVPALSMMAPQVAEELIKWLSWVEIPHEILTD